MIETESLVSIHFSPLIRILAARNLRTARDSLPEGSVGIGNQIFINELSSLEWENGKEVEESFLCALSEQDEKEKQSISGLWNGTNKPVS